MAGEQGRDGAVVLGLVAPSGMLRELAEQIAAELPGELADRLGDVNWQVRVGGAERADALPSTEALEESVRRRMQDEGWDLAVGLTDLPLRANRRPVTAHASATYRVGLLSVPALGARSVPRRAMRAVLNLVEGLLGEEVGLRRRGETGRAHRMRQRLDELRSPLGHSRAEDDGKIAFVGAALRGNLRLLVGMVRANQPARVIARLSRALAATLGTAAYAMSSSSIWMLSDGMAWPSLALLGERRRSSRCAWSWCSPTACGSERPGRTTARPSSCSISPRPRLWGLRSSRSTPACSSSVSWVARASSPRACITAASGTHRRSPTI